MLHILTKHFTFNKNFKNQFIFLLIFISGLFLRVYKFPLTVNLGTDQGAAYLIADRIINENQLLLVGPLTTVWQINLLPPTYYYLFTLFFFFLRNEIAVSFAFAIFGIFSIYLIYLAGKELFNRKTGLIASLLYATSFTMVNYGRDAWEPHLVPFFIILSLYLGISGQKLGNRKLIWLSVLSFTISLMYVSSFLLIVPFFFFWIYCFGKNFSKIRSLFEAGFAFLLFLLLNYLPVIIYESSRSFPSLGFLWQTLKGNNEYISYGRTSFINSVYDHLSLFNEALWPSFPQESLLFVAIILIVSIYFIRKGVNIFFSLITASIIWAIILTGIYQNKPEIYRFSAIFPLFFLLLAFLTSKIRRGLLWLLFIFLFTVYFYSNFSAISKIITLRENANINKLYKIAEIILKSTGTKSFTLYTITPEEKDNHYSTSYWWALEKLTGERLAILNEAGNWIEQDLDKEKEFIYLICRDFAVNEDKKSACLEKLIEKYRLERTIEDEFGYQETKIYKIRQKYLY